MTWPWPWWTAAATSQLGASTGAPDRVRKWATSSSRWSQAATSARTAVVLAATFATTGDGLRWTITFAPSARTTGSATPHRDQRRPRQRHGRRRRTRSTQHALDVPQVGLVHVRRLDDHQQAADGQAERVSDVPLRRGQLDQ